MVWCPCVSVVSIGDVVVWVWVGARDVVTNDSLCTLHSIHAIECTSLSLSVCLSHFSRRSPSVDPSPPSPPSLPFSLPFPPLLIFTTNSIAFCLAPCTDENRAWSVLRCIDWLVSVRKMSTPRLNRAGPRFSLLGSWKLSVVGW